MKPIEFSPSVRVIRCLRALVFCSAAVLAACITLAPQRTADCLLIAVFLLLALGLGGLLLVALEYLTGANWSHEIRRIPEALAGTVWISGALMIGVVALQADRLAWQPPEGFPVGTFWFKELWLNPMFLLARCVVYVLLWSMLAGAMIGTSRQQDMQPDSRLTDRNRRLSAISVLVFAPTFTLATCDWFMSLEPLWFSTVWAAYHFAGLMSSTLAAVVLLCLFLRRRGPFAGVFRDDHLHDLGKLLIGFSCFWMYLWFCQYMLIWYSNIPEETIYFATRLRGAWGPLLIANLALNWLIPFLVLLPRPAKRSGVTMARIAVVVLIGRWLDLYLMVAPSAGETAIPRFGLPEAAAITAAVSLGLWLFFRSLSRASLVPLGEPPLHVAEFQTPDHAAVRHS